MRTWRTEGLPLVNIICQGKANQYDFKLQIGMISSLKTGLLCRWVGGGGGSASQNLAILPVQVKV